MNAVVVVERHVEFMISLLMQNSQYMNMFYSGSLIRLRMIGNRLMQNRTHVSESCSIVIQIA